MCREKETQTMVRVSSPAKLRPWSELTAKMVMGVVPGFVTCTVSAALLFAHEVLHSGVVLAGLNFNYLDSHCRCRFHCSSCTIHHTICTCTFFWLEHSFHSKACRFHTWQFWGIIFLVQFLGGSKFHDTSAFWNYAFI